MVHIEETIVEAYVRSVKKWFTMANLKCGNNKEIDLLAVDLSGQRYHIEVKTFTSGWPLEIEDRGRQNVETVTYISEHHFQDRHVKAKIKEVFGENSDDSYKRILVYWQILRSLSKKEIADELKRCKIDEIWLMPQIIRELSTTDEGKYSTDVARVISLSAKAFGKE
jgi:hypothetical protein